VMTEKAAGNSRWWFSRRESAASVRLRSKGYAVTGFVQNRVLNEAWWAARDSITARSRGSWLGPRGGWLEAAQSHPLLPA
jgi:hypothetical protein